MPPTHGSTRPLSVAARYGAVLSGGAVGALLRHGMNDLLTALPGGWPWSTFTVNVLGSLALATFLTLLLETAGLHPLWRPFYAVGVCGGYTTFSTLAWETRSLIVDGRVSLALSYVTSTFVLGVAAAWIGSRAVRPVRSRLPAVLVIVLGLPAIGLAAAALVMAAHLLDVVTALAVTVGGASGAGCRYAVGGAVSARTSASFPWGTLVVNVTGCALIGLYLGMARHLAPTEFVTVLVTTGALGGYTTFSTLSYETFALADEGCWRRALYNAIGSVLAGLTAVVAGHWIGDRLG